MQKNHRWVMVVGFVVLFFLTFSGPSQAQVLYGSLTGNVTDPSGAAMPGATVQALDVAKGVAQQTTTDSAGGYNFPALLPGIYKITVSATSFASFETTDVRIEANNVRRVDVQLRVATATEKVVVSGAPPELQTDRADVHTDLRASQIEDIPIMSTAGRNFQTLLKIVPGAGQLNEANSDAGNPARSINANVNGFSSQTNITRIDGVPAVYSWLPANTAYISPAEGIAEVNIVTNSMDAEQGNAGGAMMNVITKSGSNNLHGSVFLDHTDSSLKAKNYFDSPVQGTTTFQTLPNNLYVFNQFGGSVGGPIKRDKLFFFADYQGTTRNTFARPLKTVLNPKSIFLNGAGDADFSGALPAVGALVPQVGAALNPDGSAPKVAFVNCDTTPAAGCLYDPLTGNADGTGRTQNGGANTMIVNNVVPAVFVDPAAKAMLGKIDPTGFQNSNFASGGVQAANNYLRQGPVTMNQKTGDAKINYLPNSKTTLFGRYSIMDTLYSDPAALGDALGGAIGGGQLGTAPTRVQNIGLGGTYTFSPNTVVDVNLGYLRQNLAAQYDLDLARGNVGAALGIPNTDQCGFLCQGTPSFQTSNWNNLGNDNTGNPFHFWDNAYIGNGNLSMIKGRHDLRFGMEHGRYQINHFQPQGGSFQTARGTFSFTGNMTVINPGACNAKTTVCEPGPNYANSAAQFILGVPTEVGEAVQNTIPLGIRWRTWSAYARDRFQITPKLTMTFGARWEFYPFAALAHGGVSVFDPSTGFVLVGGQGSTPITDNVRVGNGQILPRLGIAYRLTSKTVIRAGYGMSSDSNNWRFFRNNYPNTTLSDIKGSSAFTPGATLTTLNLGVLAAKYPLSSSGQPLAAGLPIITKPNTNLGRLPLPTGVGFGGDTVPFDFRRGFVHSYNLTVQRDIHGFETSVGYVGNRGVRMLTNYNLNAAPAGGGNAGTLLYGTTAVANGNPVTGPGNSNTINCACPFQSTSYNSLQATVNKDFHNGSAIGLVYTWSRAMDWEDNEELNSLMWPYPAYWLRNKSVAGFDRTHNFAFYGNYELPFGRDHRLAQHGVAEKIAGGWHLNWVLNRLSGSPFSLSSDGTSVNAPGNSQTATQTGPLNYVGGKAGWVLSGTTWTLKCTTPACYYFDPTSFAVTTGVQFGNTGRNLVRGPGFFNVDMSIFRDFRITERIKFELKGTAFGLTNTPHFGNPNANISGSNFGAITSTVNLGGSDATGTGGERQIMVGAKFTF